MDGHLGVILIALCMGLAAWFVFLWGVRTRQFKDLEKLAERQLEMDRRD